MMLFQFPLETTQPNRDDAKIVLGPDYFLKITKITLHFSGLPDLLDPSHLPSTGLVQALPQAASHLQAAHGFLRHRHPPL